jgi:tripeptide aminopeptidase
MNQITSQIKASLTERFCRYVAIDTQSDPTSETTPSTMKQKNLARLLVEELREMGISDAAMDEWGYVYATIPANTPRTDVPVICFCSHIDTSPDCSGENVRPIIHRNYDGADIVLPDDNSIVLRMAEHPDLAEQIGNDIITASGTTLLGADNKSGLAAIMEAARLLVENPSISHGTIKILFTPDEEIGRGVDKADIKRLGADFGYTVDGESLGSMEDETFSADAVTISLNGISAHPGFAKGKLENALKIAGNILANLPKEGLSPETTAGREGFVHPVRMNGIAESATLQFIIRDFVTANLKKHEALLEDVVKKVMSNYPNSKYEFVVKEQYRNMKEVLDKHPNVASFAQKAIERSGLRAKRGSIRGGTDGSRLSFMGLPCPNIFAGEHAFHSKQEWVSVQDMMKSVETILNLCAIWEEQG